MLEGKITDLFGNQAALGKHIDTVEGNHSQFRDLLLSQMPKQRIEELIEGVSKEDVKDDNGQDSISLETEKAQQARMFSLS